MHRGVYSSLLSARKQPSPQVVPTLPPSLTSFPSLPLPFPTPFPPHQKIQLHLCAFWAHAKFLVVYLYCVTQMTVFC